LGKIQTDIATNLKNNRTRAIEEQKLLEKQRIEKQKADVKRAKDKRTLEKQQRKAGLNVVHSVKNTMVGEEEGYANVRVGDEVIKVKKSNVDKARELRQKALKGEDTTKELVKLQEETSFDVMSDLDELDDDDFGGIQFGIEEDLKYLYGELAKYDPNSVEYETVYGNIEQILDEAPVLVDLVNKTVESNKGAWNLNGELLNPERGISGIALDDGAPEFDLRLEASKHIIFGTKQGRFSFESVGNKQPGFKGSSYILYTAENGKQLKIGYNEYKELVENGGGLIGSTDADPYDKGIKKIWDQNKNAYSQLKTKSTNSLTNVQGDRKVTVRTIVQDFDNANANLEKSITDFVYNGGMNNVEGKIPGYNYAQNFWQMAGGPDGSEEMRRWSNTKEQKERLSKLLIDDVKRKYASETSRTTYVNDRDAGEANVDIVSDIVNNNSILVNEDISNKYFKGKSKIGNNEQANYGYQDIYDNYNTLSDQGFRGAAEVLTDISAKNERTPRKWKGGTVLQQELIKSKGYKIEDEDGNALQDVDPTKLYVETAGGYQELDIDSFEDLMNQVRPAAGITPTNHKKAMGKVNMDVKLKDTAQETNTNKFNPIETANQLS
jgi:hypothetical protein